ncbi:hypothetical protein [Streptomyces sp. NPDC005732]|uniref:hypothetical protein n=1 Tax=Streptomyces sp. NPDC005732 TaxID=3157057 RepID=UPI003402F484
MSTGTSEGLSMARYVDLLAQRRPHVVQLAECLSLAAGVERAMLRRARLLFLPRSAAGLEAELWFSPLVEAAGEHTLLFSPEASEVLRRRLADRPRHHQEAVRQFTVESHRDARAVTRWFEDMLWADLVPSAAAERHVQSELDRALRALVTGGEAADDLSRWILHYLPRLPSGVRRYEDAWRIQVASSERLGLEPPDDLFSRPPSAITETRALVQRELFVGVGAHSDGVELSSPPADGSRLIVAPGLHRIRLDVISALAVDPAPVRVELKENQSVRLPMTVVQWLDSEGATTMSVADVGAASDVLAARSADSAGASCAVQWADGRVTLYSGAGSVAGRLPASARLRRRSLAMSPDGLMLAWIEDGATVLYDVRTGTERLVSESSEPGDLIRLLFTSDAQEPARVYAGEDRISVLGRQGVSMAAHGVSLSDSLWSSDDASWIAGVGRSGALWVWDTYGPGSESLAASVTAVSGAADGSILVWATRDGTLWYRRRGAAAGTGVMGTAPWQVTGLATTRDGGAVAAVGGDSKLLVWELQGTPSSPRPLRLRFCADRVQALFDGGWAISGTGGPVEVRTEDGRLYHVTPDTQEPLPPDAVPAWARGCVLAEVREPSGTGFQNLADRMTEIAAQGVDCLLIRHAAESPTSEDEPAPTETLTDGDFPAILLAAQQHGVRVIVEVDAGRESEDSVVHGYSGGLLEEVRELLDQDVDGICLSFEGTLRHGLLNDVRHLLDGYGDRLLVRIHTTEDGAAAELDFGGPGTGDVGCHVVVPGWDEPLARAVRAGDLGAVRWGANRSYAAEVTSILSVALSAGPGAQWGLSIPKRLTATQQTFTAAALLGLPGCPVLPLTLFQETILATLARLRRDHLALSRGTCEVVDLGLPEILAVLRRYGEESVLCVANSGTREERPRVPLDRLTAEEGVLLLDLLDGTVMPCSQSAPAVLVSEPHGVRWWRLMPASRTPAAGK